MSIESDIIKKIGNLEDKVERMGTRQSGYTLADVFGAHLMLYQLRGFWPFSSANENLGAVDFSGQSRTLTANNTPTYDLVNGSMPMITLNGTNQWFSRSSEAGLNITGNITIGGWFKAPTVPTVTGKALISKDNSVDQRSYSLFMYNSKAGFYINGGSGSALIYSTNNLVNNKWYFIVGRLYTSTEVDIFVNMEQTYSTTSIPASIATCTSDFCIGRDMYAGGGTYFAGSEALCFICAGAIPASSLTRLYTISRVFFGV